jgi:hypothetical protein
MQDYEFDGRLCFVLRRDDPEWTEEDDGIIAEWNLEDFHPAAGEMAIGDGQDHAITSICDPRLLVAPHCRLFHILYDDIHLSFTDMLRIGRVWVDLRIWIQHDMDVG